jgi:hypothetical protein
MTVGGLPPAAREAPQTIYRTTVLLLQGGQKDAADAQPCLPGAQMRGRCHGSHQQPCNKVHYVSRPMPSMSW